MPARSSVRRGIPYLRPTTLSPILHSHFHTPIAAFIGCGQDSANSFCKYEGYDEAASFEKEVGITEPTIYLLQVHSDRYGLSRPCIHSGANPVTQCTPIHSPNR